MRYTADTLTPDCYVMYRLYRFGETGRFGQEGPAKAGKHHGGVTARAWLMYEAGTRQPKLAEREKIARWLNAQAKPQVRRRITPEPTPTTENPEHA